jgi:hypothetical protein
MKNIKWNFRSYIVEDAWGLKGFKFEAIERGLMLWGGRFFSVFKDSDMYSSFIIGADHELSHSMLYEEVPTLIQNKQYLPLVTRLMGV